MDPISDSSASSKVPQLSTELQNYASWKWATASLFRTKKCHRIVNGDEPRPLPPANNATAAVRQAALTAIDEWDERAAEAMVIIQKAISGDPVLLSAVVSTGSQDPYVCMTKITSIFASTSAIAVTQLSEQFSALSNTSGVAPREYINSVVSLADRVKSAGQPVSDKQIMTKIANTVAPSNPNLQAMLLLMVDSAMSLDIFITTVVETIGMLNAKQTVAEMKTRQESLLLTTDARQKYRGNSSFRRNTDQRAYRGNKQGRFKQNYQARFGTDAANRISPPAKPTASSTLVCFRCGGKGHRERQCPSAAPGDKNNSRA
mmetsp:Transcript_111753/g.240969  ORF Transcript_111753/g.240969 Transcript_111753/m.240969 type:complete len:317 (-) Transcript_111753:105-1055(-)